MKRKILILCACAMLIACNTNEVKQANTPIVDEKREEVLTKPEEKDDTIEEREKNKIVLSALGSEEKIEEVREILIKAGIKESLVDLFAIDILKYNELSENSLSEYVDVEKKDYNNLIDKYIENSNMIGNNCRITTFGLMRDFVNIDAVVSDETTTLAFDKKSIEEQNKMSQDELRKFITYYAAIKTEKNNDANFQAQQIKNALNKRKINFNKKDATVISVYLNSNDELDGNILFVGHTGLLVEKDDKIYFIEKLSFQEPYQMVIFNNRGELVKYLLEKYDYALGENTSKAIIFENDELISAN